MTIIICVLSVRTLHVCVKLRPHECGSRAFGVIAVACCNAVWLVTQEWSGPAWMRILVIPCLVDCSTVLFRDLDELDNIIVIHLTYPVCGVEPCLHFLPALTETILFTWYSCWMRLAFHVYCYGAQIYLGLLGSALLTQTWVKRTTKYLLGCGHFEVLIQSWILEHRLANLCVRSSQKHGDLHWKTRFGTEEEGIHSPAAWMQAGARCLCTMQRTRRGEPTSSKDTSRSPEVDSRAW